MFTFISTYTFVFYFSYNLNILVVFDQKNILVVFFKRYFSPKLSYLIIFHCFGKKNQYFMFILLLYWTLHVRAKHMRYTSINNFEFILLKSFVQKLNKGKNKCSFQNVIKTIYFSSSQS